MRSLFKKNDSQDSEVSQYVRMVHDMLKDIVQPKKRGVKRGMNQFVSTSYTIADIFFEHLKG